VDCARVVDGRTNNADTATMVDTMRITLFIAYAPEIIE
jgi:hypothetical protein